ncbi:MAG: multicopper oxidase domain-containing protein [Acidobacteria bacterium]|nr:multicopper oxidase domain-containing protein [Acidobacteriota bacterium]
MQSSRRHFLRGVATLVGTAGAARASAQHDHSAPEAPQPPRTPAGRPPVAPVQAIAGPQILPGIAEVVTPDVPKMPWRLENGVKVFRIVVEHVRTEFVPGRIVDAWGFNGSVPGPTIEVVEGDRVRFVVENRLPEPFSMHWHGLEVPNDMDGMPGISQEAIPPGGFFTYEFTLRQNGTFFYHSHMAMQEMMGLIGLFIIHPRQPHTPRVDRDFGLVLQEWAILPNNTVPNSLAMEFNWLTINGKSGPATTPLLVKRGERVRIRIVNLGMDHHPMHLHGHQFYVTGTEGGRIRTTAVEPANTVLVGVAQARDIEFVADNPGDWHFHCHLPHHMMNQMVSMVGPLMMSPANMPRPGTAEAGMGIHEGAAFGDAASPAFGRTINLGAAMERPVANMPMSALAVPQQTGPAVAPNAGMYPGYPQDMFMVMDDLVAKPETYGLRRGWSGGTMGMMTIVRVLEPELFDRIQALRTEQAGKGARQ